LKPKSKFIYLISPNKISLNFYESLISVLKTKKVKYFQLRLKNTSNKNIISISNKIKKICKIYNVKFIINDNPIIAKKVCADGCHLGQSDMNIIDARKILKNKIIGITCNNSIEKAKEAINNKADYIALGAFNSSETKKVKFRATLKDLKKFRRLTRKPLVAIGGINQYNYKKLLLNKADFLAISSFVWKNKKLKPLEAINKIK
jgi:Thiamine monophosphate synthase|tara:strand:+ start:810 stop:1421 length:612 start_codon:yes stop_codon:yes gene_type:complete